MIFSKFGGREALGLAESKPVKPEPKPPVKPQRVKDESGKRGKLSKDNVLEFTSEHYTEGWSVGGA